MLVQRDDAMLVQNQTTFSASHVQAYWAHLDHAVYKKEVYEHMAEQEAVAEKQPQFKWSKVLLIAEKQQGQLRRMLSLAVDTVSQLKVGVVTVHSLCIACFTSHNRKTAPQDNALRT